MAVAGDRLISDFLASLAAREPAPGGGAAAALSAAQSAALVAMVARYSDRGEDGAEALAARIVKDADRLRERATTLIQWDIDAFAAVAEAYKLPKESDADKQARQEAIATASIGAAHVPADVVAVATGLIDLCDELLPIANRNVITDVAAAADAARAAAATARLNVEINLGSITNEAAKTGFVEAIDGVDTLLKRADKISAKVRGGL